MLIYIHLKQSPRAFFIKSKALLLSENGSTEPYYDFIEVVNVQNTYKAC